MSVRKLPGGGHAVYVKLRGPDGVVRRARRQDATWTRAQALAEELALRTALAAGTPPTGPSPSPGTAPSCGLVSSVVGDFLAWSAVHQSPAEAAAKTRIFRLHLTPAFGARRLDQVTVADVDAFVRDRLTTRSRKTVNNFLAVWSGFGRWAVDHGHPVGWLPVRFLETPPPPFDWLTPAELGALTACALQPSWVGPMIVTAAGTGLRLGELRALRWTNAGLGNGRLLVASALWEGVEGAPKNGRTRVVPLPKRVRVVLDTWRDRAPVGPYVFGGAAPLTRNATKRPLWRACAAAGLRRIGWHVLRHTYASHLVSRGASLQAVKELLGHASLAMTLRYAHLAPEALDSAARLLDDLDE